MLKEVGIATEVRVVAWPTFIAEFVNKRKFDAVILGWSLGLDPDQYDIWHSSKTAEHEYNFVGYKNPEVDRLLERGRGTFNLAERTRVYHRIHRLLARDLPYVFLFAPEALVALDNRFEGVEQTPIGISWNLHKWHVPQARQRYLMAE
jgi:peptide/nickel transport system substrate-binding protein